MTVFKKKRKRQKDDDDDDVCYYIRWSLKLERKAQRVGQRIIFSNAGGERRGKSGKIE